MTMTVVAAGVAAPPFVEEDEPPTWYVPLGGIFGLRSGFAFGALLERGGARLRSSASRSAACKCSATTSSGIGVPSS